MHTYKIEEARKIVMNCAKQYDNNLKDKQYIILFRCRQTNKIQYIEVKFEDINYQHLTGIEMLDSTGQIRKNVSSLFYSKCIRNTLKKEEICFKSDGTSHLKLFALPVIMNIQKVTKIAGDYNSSRTYLVADKLIGNVNFCLGLKEISNNFYVPASALLEDIKKLTVNPSQVIAIFSKNMHDTLYETVRYVAKGVDLNRINLPINISAKISLKNNILHYSLK